MVDVLVAILAPTVGFGLFALLCMRYGAETRPYFDEQPVVDDRPNWFPIAGAGGRDDDEDEDDPQDGEPDAVDAPTPAPARRQPRPVPVPVASATSAATSPSGV
jgi:hypothetical protein